MAQTSNKTPRNLAVLALPKRIGAIIAYATGVVQGMTGNPTFPTPVVPLAMVAAAIDDLRDAEAAAMTRTKGAAAARNASRGALVAMLHLLRIYVQSVADKSSDHGSAIIQSAGMAVKKITPRPRRVFAAFAGAVPGTVKIVAPSAGHRASYDWQYAMDGATWVGLGTTLQASTTMTDQSAGTVLHLRYRAVTRTGQAAWSAAITFTVSSS